MFYIGRVLFWYIATEQYSRMIEPSSDHVGRVSRVGISDLDTLMSFTRQHPAQQPPRRHIEVHYRC